MKVFLDENLPHELRPHLQGHDVFTVQYMGWSGVKNGLLLIQAAAAADGAIFTSSVLTPDDLADTEPGVTP